MNFWRRLIWSMVWTAVAFAANAEDVGKMRAILPRVVAGMQPLANRQARGVTPDERAYFSFYGLDLAVAAHRFGFFEQDGRRIAAHIFEVEAARGTAILVHGYYDHAGVLAGIAGMLTAAGLDVVVYDQPGHGLSSGRRAMIDDFGDYAKLFLAVVEKCRGEWGLPSPTHVVAHSMGAAAVMDALLKDELDTLGNVVFIAPLVRSKHWHLSGAGTTIATWFTDDIVRVFRNNSADKEFRDFVKRDPLQAHVVPFAWVEAHRRWVEDVRNAPPSSFAPTILQGRRDNVVDARYNLRFLRRKFPRCRILRYPRGGHQLMNEIAPLRETVLDDIRQALLPES